ncbi:GNAT family N-acetyltransferase [Larsenimonas suaedae]|uniref:GNAT family N-acetyltransferase n=1 Tax=Larsenimonas suaedae TaxID=1851019 RepID=A0ABU1GW13_9GAMM|nr:GNAT family N-acetyltransferase [Larsenimonas suaedae]MCM2973342.1 GNAT family N-acetyltransferase [Larsenimonas suaedae]MDR5896235.1 GNAT family N-acetyltransferase [Larsenimonas suaedae]
MQLTRVTTAHPAVCALIEFHLEHMAATSPPESRHALGLEQYSASEIALYGLWLGEDLAGIGALKPLGAGEGELKSMRTAPAFLRRGVARCLLAHLIDEATRLGYHCLRLETGAQPYFDPARRLYQAFGFEPCPAFAAYTDDPNSQYMMKRLT